MAKAPNITSLTADGTVSFGNLDGKYAISLVGGFGGGTASVQHSNASDGTFTEFGTNGSYTSAAEFTLDWSGFVRVVLSSSTSPTLSVTISKIG